MGCYMIGLIAFYFVLRIVFTGVMGIAFIFKIGMMDFYDFPAYLSSFRVLFYVIAYFKYFHNPLFDIES